jgi:tetratricopeptide (TPR) repeat protein
MINHKQKILMKICLTSLLLWGGSVLAQTSSFNGSDFVSPNNAITIAVSSFDENDGNTYFSEAEKNERSGDLNDAVTYFGKAAFEYNNSRNFTRYGLALMRLSNVHYMLANYTEAEQVVLNVALKNYARIGSKVGQMNSYSQLGKICLSANKLTESLWFYTQQGILAQQMRNNTAYLESILGIAYVKIKKGEYVMASRDLNRAELLARSYNNSEFKGRIKDARAQIAKKKA